MLPVSSADVVFVFPPAYGNRGAFKNHLGVAYLRAALAREPFQTVQYLNQNPGTIDEVSDDILKYRPRVVGFTVYDANLALSIALARSMKRRRPDVRVVFGGPSASFGAAQILESQPQVDACVVGEAEETGAQILGALLNARFIEDPPLGLVIRRDGTVVNAALPPLVGATGSTLPPQSILDAAPSPYLTGTLDDGRVGILTGRGCTHHCQYCCFAALGRKKLRLHSIERVLAELEYIADLQKRSGERYIVPLHDDAFTLLPTRAKSLCQSIIDRHFDLVLSCITRADAIDEELVQLMRGAGFVSLAFGLESSVPSVLRAMGKVRPPDWAQSDLAPEREFVRRVRDSVVTAKRFGFNVGVSIILGLPTETPADGEATLRFVKSLPIDFYMHNFLWVFPGTPLWDTHDRYGIGCAVNSMGLAVTTDYAYDVTKLRPRPKCSLEQDARVVKTLAADALYGCGASLAAESGTSVAVLHAGKLTHTTAEWLSRVLDVGSTVVQVYPSLKRSEEALKLYEDRRVFSDCLVPSRHHVQLLPRTKKDGCARWMLACSGTDLYCMHKPELVSLTTSSTAVPLVRWLGARATNCNVCEVSGALRRPEKLVRFVSQTGDDNVGARVRRMPVPPRVRYPGRWLEGAAPCLSLTRLEIDAHGRVRSCSHGEPIGMVGDERQTLTHRLVSLAAEAERRRECDNCPSTQCPRCPFPGVDDRTYCQIMRTDGRALDLLKWVHLYSRVPSILAVQRDKLGGD